MITLAQLLLDLGLGVTSNAIYEYLKGRFAQSPYLTCDELKAGLSSFLCVSNTDVVAGAIIDVLAKNGDILIEGSRLRANASISMFSSQRTKFVFGNKSVSETKSTRIIAGEGARIEGRGGAGIRQNEDGSISFFA